MGHRGFTQSSGPSKSYQASQEKNYSRAPNPSARNYFDEMAPVNGIRELSEEQLEEAQELREKFRDDVSKKMGELLLRGVTMLDAYCQTCNGILMEHGNGVRTCVTCELFAERMAEGSRLVAEVPLDTTADGFTPGNSALSEGHPTTRNVVRVVDVERKQWAEGNVPPVGLKESTPSAPNTSAPPKPAGFLETSYSFDGCATALMAIDRKLKWASERIDRSENASEIREMFALINEGLNIIRHARVGKEQ